MRFELLCLFVRIKYWSFVSRFFWGKPRLRLSLMVLGLCCEFRAKMDSTFLA